MVLKSKLKSSVAVGSSARGSTSLKKMSSVSVKSSSLVSMSSEAAFFSATAAVVTAAAVVLPETGALSALRAGDAVAFSLLVCL